MLVCLPQKYLVLMSFLESKIHSCDTPQAFELLSHSPSHRLFEQMTHIFLAGPSYWSDSIEDFFSFVLRLFQMRI